ncbi:MAG: hypothetical protein JKY54_14870 [Flavobacteriales bacterium]|nr:hypothetical protein [Flavobacteriales bacterium]
MQESIFKTLKASSFLWLIPLFGLVSCNDIFEEDLSDDILTLTLPADGTITTTQSTYFLWDQVAGATQYNLEVVSPSFFGITSYVYDSIVTSNSITLTLYPGTYEWRVRAENFGSSTAYSEMYSLIIDTTSDLSVQTITLSNPTNVAYNTSTIGFSWLSLSSAESYQVQLYSGSTFASGTLLMDSTVTGTSITGFTIDEGEFSWGVKGLNSVPSETAYSSSYFEMDRVSPQTVSLVDPDAGIIATDSTFNYAWTSLSDTGTYQTTLIDSIYVATDSLFSNIYDRFGSSIGSQSDLIPLPDIYYWRIKTFDAAGNSSGYSDFNSFEIQ